MQRAEWPQRWERERGGRERGARDRYRRAVGVAAGGQEEALAGGGAHDVSGGRRRCRWRFLESIAGDVYHAARADRAGAQGVDEGGGWCLVEVDTQIGKWIEAFF